MEPIEKTDEQKLIEKISNEVNRVLTGSQATTDERLKALTAQLEALNEKTDATKEGSLAKEVVSLQSTVAALKEAGVGSGKEGFKTIGEALTAAFAEKKDEIDAIVKSGGQQKSSLKLELKAVGTMSVASTIGAGATQVTITENTGIVSTIRKRELTYLAQVSVGSIGTNRALWIEETDEEGAPIFIAEGASKTQLDVQYVEQTKAVKKIAVFGKVTTELMADIPQLISYIQNNLMRRMDIKLETELFDGNDVGDNIKGLNGFATAFSAGSLALQVDNANELDVMQAIALQVKVAFGLPNALFINPATMAKIKLIKDTTGRPIWKDYVTITGDVVVSGMTIIETTAVAADQFVGGDTKVANVLIRDEMGIVIGLDGNDFTQNKKTMLLEKRLVQFVSANDTPVIVKGDFSAAAALLETP